MKIKGILKTLIVFFLIFLLTTNIVLAYETGDATQFDPITPEENSSNLVAIDNFINNILGKVLAVLRTIAFCIAIIMLMIIGIKYMITIDAGMKAELKKQIPMYLTGAIISFALSGILQIATYIVNDVLPTS